MIIVIVFGEETFSFAFIKEKQDKNIPPKVTSDDCFIHTFIGSI